MYVIVHWILDFKQILLLYLVKKFVVVFGTLVGVFVFSVDH